MLRKKTSAFISLILVLLMANTIHAQCPIAVNQIVYSQSSVYSGNIAATNSLMTNGDYAEPLATGTDNGTEWIKMDLGAVNAVKAVVIGSDFDNTLAGGWGKSYTENKNVQYSSDNVTWTTAFNTGIFNQGIKTFPVNFSARYIRIVSTGWVSVTEFYATSVVPPSIAVSSNSICQGNSTTLTAISPAGSSNAMIFDGVNDYMATNFNCDVAVVPVTTWEAWVYPTAQNGNWQMIMSVEDNGWDRFIAINNLQVYMGYGCNGWNPTSLTLNQWQHIAVVYNEPGNQIIFYKNGVPFTFSIPGNCTHTSAVKYTLACSTQGQPGQFFAGVLDEVRVWNIARTQADIVANMSVTIPSNSPGLALNYQFNEGSGLYTANAVGASYTGTLTNGPTWQVPSTAPITSTALATGTFSWSNGATTASIVVSPSVTTTYSVVNTNSASCSVTSTPITVSVTPLPVVSVSGFSAICAGQTATLTASGASTYTWSNASTASSITLSPLSDASYTVRGTAAGCEGSISQTLVVNPLPTITVNSGTICAGQNFTLNPAGASTYTIQGGSAVVSPSTNATYTVVGTSTAGCVSPAFITSSLSVNASPMITVNNGTICAGQVFTINPNGADTYTIQGGNAVVSPSINSTYSVIGTNTLTGCISSAATTSSLMVNPNPVITVNNGTICVGQAFTITPNGANTYTIQGGNAVVNPSINTTYTVAGTSAAGCVSQAFATSSLMVNPNPIITVNNGTICAGQPFTITPNGANTYTIQGGNAVVSPSINATYTVAGTSTAGCVSQAVATSSLMVNPNPNITVNSGAICAGQSFTITPNGANTYTIQGGNAVVNPSINTTYTVAGTSTAGCVSQAVATSSLIVNPNPVITVNNGTICVGQAFTITPNGANTYTIQGGNAVVNPSINTTYTVAGTSTAGCVSQAVATSSLMVNPNPVITVNNGTICAGQPFTITPNGANTYTIQGGNAVVSPTINATYTVAGTSTAGCVSQAVATSSLMVNPNPVITVNNGTICAGQNFTITPNGANTYTIQGGNAVVSPPSNTSYTVVGTNTVTGCRSQAFATSSLIVNPIPVITVNNGTICAGQNFTITPNGASTYTIQGGNAVVNPSINATYTVAGTSTAGCVSQALATSSLMVNPLPVVTVNNGTICVGQTFTITPNGANTYTIQGGNAVVSPSINATYTVAGTSTAGCVSQALATSSLMVNPNPVITVNNGTICAGQNFTITPNGANTYTIQGGNAVVSPPSNTSYTVVGTNTVTGCRSQAFATSSLMVNPLPVVTVNNGTICAGQNFTITPNGASTYTIQGGNAVVSPSITATYTVAGTSTAGCVSSVAATSSLLVNQNPTVSIAGASGICSGQNATLTASGAPNYTWSTGSNSGTIVTTPTANTTYTLTGSTPQGCSSSTTQLVTVQLSLSVSITGPSSVCDGQIANLSGLGGVTYTWNTGATTTTLAPTLTTTTTFSVIGASGTCSNTAIKTISVTPNPTVTITGTTAICNGATASLTVNGATTYTWSTLSTNTAVAVSPSATTVYSVVGSFSTGCFQIAAQTVSVYALPVVSISGPSVICEGDSITLNANGAAGYVWNNAATTSSIVVSPTATASYSAIGTTSNGCSSSASSTVTVNPTPVLTVVKTASAICQGDSLSFTATGADTYAWSNGANTASIVVTPTGSATYSVVGTNTFGCSSLEIDSVKVNALPVLTITGNSGTICIGETLVLNLNGAATYSWSTGASTSSISVSPSVASTYSATGTSTDACVSAITTSVQVSECTGINTIASYTGTKVYPNPNNGEFMIELTSTNEASITITNVIGQVILTQPAGLINKMNLNAFDKGIYFITITENNKSVYRGSVIKE